MEESREERRQNGGVQQPLHPTIAALSIVLDLDEDLGTISRTHPYLDQHTHFQQNAVFPADISGLLPPPADRWWEILGM
jgi:hypothetical protein